MARLIVQPLSRPLGGSVPVPADKSISHRALIMAALTHGPCQLEGFSYGEDNVATQRAFAQMGVRIEDDAHGTLRVHGVGLDGLAAPSSEIDCGNSGTTMRLLAGVLAGQPFASRLVGDASLSRRPMSRIVKPLLLRGAVISGTPRGDSGDEVTAPLSVGPLPAGRRLEPLEYQLPVASAQVKSALLFSGLWASGPTLVREPLVSRDHTERMLSALGLLIETAGPIVKLHPPADPKSIRPFTVELPGDLSAAAFVLAAGLLSEGGVVTTRATGVNPTRSGFIDIVRRLGGELSVVPRGESLGEPRAEITARFSGLRGQSVGGELALRAIDEIPICAALAARATGCTRFFDVAELRVKESDRIAAIVALLGAFGVEASEHEDGFSVEGRPSGRLQAAQVESRGDHRIAMTAAVLGLLGDGPTVVNDVACIATSFPRFVGTLRALGAQLEIEP
ncbi:MAG: 3-phosphoshikimate 1-carboxyvinyltransferase [Polyangiaceae bacterium]|nr:3-phosphoshikimate 1-carboxyvinyltransferase [Polyangiaceae bacterium]